jgi:hypothetical protein
MAPSLEEKAAEYARRIRRAAMLYEVRAASAGTKTASDVAASVVSEVLHEVGQLRFESGTRLDPAQVDQLLLEIDDQLDVRPGTMRSIKEGSVKMLLQYNQLVTQLMQSISAKK